MSAFAPASTSVVPPNPPLHWTFTGCGNVIVRPAKKVTSPPIPSAPVDMLAIGFKTVRSSPASKSNSPPDPPAAALMSPCPVTVMLPVSEVMS